MTTEVRDISVCPARAPFGDPPTLRAFVDDCSDWFAAFVDRVLPSLLTLMCWGVALSAHEQNLLLVLRWGCPHRLIYRDLADIR